jgi:hypothetical protein
MVYINRKVSSPSKICSSTVYCCTIAIFSFILGYIIFTPTETIIQFVRISAGFKPLTTVAPYYEKIVYRKPTESFICDNPDINRFPVSSAPLFNDTFDKYRVKTLEKYCDIVPIPLFTWEKAATYTEDEVVFVIFTASTFFHTRATAARDTWLSRVTNYYFLSTIPYPYLPATVVPGTTEAKTSNMKKLFDGLRMVYQEQIKLPLMQQPKWFYITTCDTFILPHHLLKRIDGLNFAQPLLVGGQSTLYQCPGPKGKRFYIDQPSVNAGYFLSIKALELLQPHLNNYSEKVWKDSPELSDAALCCLAAQLQIRLQKREGFWGNTPQQTLTWTGRDKYHKEPEPNNYHYIKPNEMYALDEFYVNQHMDRLIKSQNWRQLSEYSRRFVASHYELIRKKRRECTLPIIEHEHIDS